MLRSLKDLIGYTILATDGEIGRVQDFYFDVPAWTIRYLVVDTGAWLSNRRVFLSPIVLQQPDWEAHTLPVSLTREQVRNSPDIDPNKSISRHQEAQLVAYYNWSPYWDTATFLPTKAAVDLVPLAPLPSSGTDMETIEQTLLEETLDDPHLYRTNEVIGYYVQARDDDIGHLDNFLSDDETWAIQYLIVDTRNWLPGKKVQIAASWVKTIHWTERTINIDLQRETIENSPEYKTEFQTDESKG